VGYTAPGEWLEYTINVPAAGSYDIQTRLAAVQSGTLHYEVDGQSRATVNVTPTAGFQSYTTLTHALGTLSAGTHVLRLQFDSTSGTRGVANVNWLKVVPSSTQQDTQAPSAVPEFLVLPFEDLGFIEYRMKWLAPTDNVGVAGYRVSYTHHGDFDDDGDMEQRVETRTFGPDTRSGVIGITTPGELFDFSILAFDAAANAGPPVPVNAPAVPRGLTGTYYNNADFTNPAFTRIDPTINFDWGAGSPDSRIAPDTFSVRWSGHISVSDEANYTFYVPADDRARLIINGQTVVNYIPGQTPSSGSITLDWGYHTIVYEYAEFTGNARAKLEWSHPGMARRIVPQSALLSS
jgi:hypothetical protein